MAANGPDDGQGDQDDEDGPGAHANPDQQKR